MPFSNPVRSRPYLFASALACLLVIVGCSGSGTSKAKGSTTTTAATTTAPPTTTAGTASTAQPSTEAAVRALLTAEQRNDHAGSYRLLDDNGRREFKDQSEWERRRSQLPAVTGFSIEPGSTEDRVTATVEHTPGLDPFIGLSPAKERQVFTGVRQAGGWLLEAQPDVQYLFPPDASAQQAAGQWAQALQACDQAGAAALQGVPTLFGTSAGAAQLCHSTGAVTTGPVQPLEAGPASADLVAQYSTDALEWARSVPVSGPVPPFHVVLAPLGDSWKIIGTYD